MFTNFGHFDKEKIEMIYGVDWKKMPAELSSKTIMLEQWKYMVEELCMSRKIIDMIYCKSCYARSIQAKFRGQVKLNIKEIIKRTNLYLHGVENFSISEESKAKRRKTMKEKYGVEYSWQSTELKNKMQKTMIEKYGTYSPSYSKEIVQKRKQTMKERYGVEYSGQSTELKNKMQKTMIEKYGVDNYTKTNEYKEKAKQTCLKKYGVTNYSKSKEKRLKYQDRDYVNKISEKNYITKKKNNSFNISKSEDKIYELLTKIFLNVERQYRSELYPFNCDFYIPSLDLYIEYNGNWTHGKESYDVNNIEHQKKLNKWKELSKSSKFYKNAIYVWTDLDVRKRSIAIQNGINFVELWTMKEAEEFIDKLKQQKKDIELI